MPTPTLPRIDYQSESPSSPDLLKDVRDARTPSFRAGGVGQGSLIFTRPPSVTGFESNASTPCPSKDRVCGRDFCDRDTLLSSPSANRSGAGSSRCAQLGDGVIWHCCELDSQCLPTNLDALQEASWDIAEAASLDVADERDPVLSGPEIATALRAATDCRSPCSSVHVLVPENMAEFDYCCWTGDGHFNMSGYSQSHPPSLRQIFTFLKMTSPTEEHFLTIHLTSTTKRAFGAVLSGAQLILKKDFTAQEAWDVVARACPPIDPDPAKAWDRFASPFSKTGETTKSSLKVFDCLAALEFARQKSWLAEYSDIGAWQFLREKMDASWVIPGEVLALGNPWITAKNPRFPDLLDDESGPEAVKVSFSEMISPRSASPSTASTGESWKPSGSPINCSALNKGMPKIITNFGNKGCPVETAFEEMPEPIPDSPISRASSGWASPLVDSWSFDPPSPKLSSKLEPETTEMHTPRLSPSQQSTFSDQPRQVDANGLESPELQLLSKDSFVTFMKRSRITSVVQLNHPFECPGQEAYEQIFQKNLLSLSPLPFEDGSIPSRSQVKYFLKLCRKIGIDQEGVAVHCMSGVGRTATMIGTYAVSHHGMSGATYHGWVRMCRPGSVQTRCQEVFLRKLQPPGSQPKVNSISGMFDMIKNLVDGPPL